MVNGRNVVLWDGHTYYRKNKSKNLFKWACTMSGSCTAHLKIDDDMIIRETSDQHSHIKKPIVQMSNGRYIRL